MASHAVEGGTSAKNLLDFDSEVRKVLACSDPFALAVFDKEAAARKDLWDTLRTLKKRQKRKSCSQWRAELLIMALDPLYFAVRDSVPHRLDFDNGMC